MGETGVAVLNWFIGMCTKAKTELSGEKEALMSSSPAREGRTRVHSNPQITKFSGWVIKKVIDTEWTLAVDKVASEWTKGPTKRHFSGRRK